MDETLTMTPRRVSAGTWCSARTAALYVGVEHVCSSFRAGMVDWGKPSEDSIRRCMHFKVSPEEPGYQTVRLPVNDGI